MRYLGTLLLIGLIVFCVIEIVRSDDDERLGVHPALWVLLVVLFPLVGCIVWLAVSRTRRGSRAQRGFPGPAQAPPAPVAPDDDPEFLWRLEQERRRRQAEDKDEPRDQTGPTA